MAAPIIRGIILDSINESLVAFGTSVEILGEGFNGASTVTFGSIRLDVVIFEVLNDGTIYAKVPQSLSQGTYNVVVSVPGEPDSNPFTFTVQPM